LYYKSNELCSKSIANNTGNSTQPIWYAKN
jgi:hypothetical protein